ncbi:hypothetical protein OSB04_029222 [Centaurea solstitialis]|uniref:Uncharacterized protein n=1 Tax=Centaurea solstitialis TaxID=347529 RepID=A0AA38SVL7_9ASTR|nr:hypothetical protein OSB04_029222 [Centaurea solstitialis]
MLDCATVVWVIILTWLFLGTKYSMWQFFGAALCVSGLCLVLLSDSGVGGGGGSNPILGDAIVIVGTCFFALSNVHVSNTQEFCVKKVGRVEVISMLGLFGMLMSGIEMYPRVNPRVVTLGMTLRLSAGQAAGGDPRFDPPFLLDDFWSFPKRVRLYEHGFSDMSTRLDGFGQRLDLAGIPEIPPEQRRHRQVRRRGTDGASSSHQ